MLSVPGYQLPSILSGAASDPGGHWGASVQLSQLFYVYYSIRDLDIEQDDGLEFQDDRNYLNEWGLAINTEIPVSLNATLPAGESGLDLSDLNLESFTMQIGA